MADQIKVFKNVVGQTVSSNPNAFTISGFTTDSSTKAVVKDVQFNIVATDPTYEGIYSYPAKVKLNSFPILDTTSGTSIKMEGSQIIDSSSTFDIEIQAEAAKKDYGRSIVFQASNNGTFIYNLDINSLSDPTNSSTVLNKLYLTKISLGLGATPSNGVAYFYKNGKHHFAYTDGGGTLYFVDEDGNTSNVGLPYGCSQITSDDTYIYAKSTSSGTTLARVAIADLTSYSTLSLSTTLPGTGASNPGFFEYYNGIIYDRPTGSGSAVYKIPVDTGTLSSLTIPTSQTEHLGARITVARDGVPYLVEWCDTKGIVYNMNTVTQVGSDLPLPSGLTNPTTTVSNHSCTIAPGVVLFNNASYGQTWMIDVNGTPTVTDTTSIFPSSSGTNYGIGSKSFQTPVADIPRASTYNLLITGIESF